MAEGSDDKGRDNVVNIADFLEIGRTEEGGVIIEIVTHRESDLRQLMESLGLEDYDQLTDTATDVTGQLVADVRNGYAVGSLDLDTCVFTELVNPELERISPLAPFRKRPRYITPVED